MSYPPQPNPEQDPSTPQNYPQMPPPPSGPPPAPPAAPSAYNTPYPPAPPYGQPVNKNMAVTALVLAIVSFFCFGILLSIPAAILAIIVLVKAKPGKGQATAALIVAGLNILLSAILIPYMYLTVLNNVEELQQPSPTTTSSPQTREPSQLSSGFDALGSDAVLLAEALIAQDYETNTWTPDDYKLVATSLFDTEVEPYTITTVNSPDGFTLSSDGATKVAIANADSCISMNVSGPFNMLFYNGPASPSGDGYCSGTEVSDPYATTT